MYFADGSGHAHERPSQGAEPGYNGMRAGRQVLPLGGWAVGGQPRLGVGAHRHPLGDGGGHLEIEEFLGHAGPVGGQFRDAQPLSQGDL